jgi:aspartate racemase
VRQESLGAYAHQDLPFERLVEVLHPQRDPGRTPLFQVMFVLQNAPLPALKSPELELTPLEVEIGAAKFDLTLFVTESDEGLLATMEYSSDLFEAATIDRMLGHYRTLLEGVVAQPERPIGTLPMMTEEEQRQVLGQWNDTATEDLASAVNVLSEAELDSLLRRMSSEKGATDE